MSDADTRRALRTFQTKESPIGKLFAKHIKLEEAKQFLQRARYITHGMKGSANDLLTIRLRTSESDSELARPQESRT